MHWFILLIPFVIGLGKKFLFKERITILEMALPISVGALFILIYAFTVKKTLTNDTEYMMGYVKKIEHVEQWEEWIEETCSYECCCDDKGNGCQTIEYDCSYEYTHSPYWQVVTDGGKVIGISEQEYYDIKRLWNLPEFSDEIHKYEDNSNNGRNKDGTYFSTTLNNTSNLAKILPLTWTHTYENRTQAASSVFNFEEIDTNIKSQYNLVDYPVVKNYETNSILGYNKGLDNKYVNKLNSLIARNKQLKVFYIIFDGQPEMAGHYQEQYWKGGNKNEMNICIGTYDGKIDWVYAFSWSEAEKLKVDLREEVMTKFDDKELKSNFNGIVNLSFEYMKEQFVRKEFADFNYLNVTIPTKHIMWMVIITLVLSLGVSIWTINNEFEEGYRRY